MKHKRIISLVLTVAMMLSMCITGFAVDAGEKDGGISSSNESSTPEYTNYTDRGLMLNDMNSDVIKDLDHTGWTVLTNENAQTELDKGYGSYYLTDDLTVDLTIPKPSVLNSVTICLEGKNILGSITVESGAVLNIYDCKQAASINFGKIVNNGGTINLTCVNSVVESIENSANGQNVANGQDVFSTTNIVAGSFTSNGDVLNTASDGGVSTLNITGIRTPSIKGNVINSGTNAVAVINFNNITITGDVENRGSISTTLNLTGSRVKGSIQNTATANLYESAVDGDIVNRGKAAVLNVYDSSVPHIQSTDGTLNVYDSQITNMNGAAIEISNGTLNLSGTTADGVNGVKATNSATLNIKNSTVTGTNDYGIDMAWDTDTPGAINLENSIISGQTYGIHSIGDGVHAINVVDSTITGSEKYGIYNTGKGAINLGSGVAITGGNTADVYTDTSIAACAYGTQYSGDDITIQYGAEKDPVQTIFVTNATEESVFTVKDSLGAEISCQRFGTNLATSCADHAAPWKKLEWTGSKPSLATGCYYLGADIEPNPYSPNEEITISSGDKVTICLCGHSLKVKSITVNSGGVLNIYDCSDDGTGKVQTAINVESGGTLNLNGSNFTTINNSGLCVVHGGAINEVADGISNTGGTLIVRGATIGAMCYPTIKNETGGSIQIYSMKAADNVKKSSTYWDLYMLENGPGCSMTMVGGMAECDAAFPDDNVILYNDGGTLQIYGGYFRAKNRTSALGKSDEGTTKTEIRGGTFIGESSKNNSRDYKVPLSVSNGYMSGGEVRYEVTVDGTPAGSFLSGSNFSVQGGTFFTDAPFTDTPFEPSGVSLSGENASIQGGMFSLSENANVDNRRSKKYIYASTSDSPFVFSGGVVTCTSDDSKSQLEYAIEIKTDAIVTGGRIFSCRNAVYLHPTLQQGKLIFAGGQTNGNHSGIDASNFFHPAQVIVTGGEMEALTWGGANAGLYMSGSTSAEGSMIKIKGGVVYSSDAGAIFSIWDTHIEGGTFLIQSTRNYGISINGSHKEPYFLGGYAMNVATAKPYFKAPPVLCCYQNSTAASTSAYIKGGVFRSGYTGVGITVSGRGLVYLSGAPIIKGERADLITEDEARISVRTPEDNLVYIGSKIYPNTVSYEAEDKSIGKIVIFNATEGDLAKFDMTFPTDKMLVYWDYEKCDANGSYDNVKDLDKDDRFDGSEGNLVLFGIDITATVDKMPESYLGGVDAQGQYQGLPKFTLSFPEGWYVSVDGGDTYKSAEQYEDKANALYDIWFSYYDFSSGEPKLDVLNWDRDAGLYYAIPELSPKENVLLADNPEGEIPCRPPEPELEPAEGYDPSDPTDLFSTIRFTSQENVDVNNRNKRNLLVTMTESGTAFTNTDAENLSGLVAQNTKALTTAKENAEKDKDRVQGVAVIPQGTTLYRNDDSTLGEALAEDVGLLFDALTKEEEKHADILQDKVEKVLLLTDSDKRAYEYKYADLVEHTNANVWVSSSNGSLMLWPYPEGTNQNTEFQMVHFGDINRDYGILDYGATIAAGSEEPIFKEDEEEQFKNSTAYIVPCVTTEDGIVCYVRKDEYGMFALAWEPEDAGNLDVKLQIADNVSGIGDNDEFRFRLEMEDEEINGTYNDLEITNGVAKFSLTPNESVTINELPAGAKYTVTYMPDTPAEMPSHIHDAECGYVEAVAGSPCNHVHDESCGYVAAVEGSPCTHVHSDECYTLKTDCVIAKDEQASENMSEEELAQTPMVLPSLADDHVCTEESGCITKVLNCQHVHDTECGYVETVEPHDCNHVHDDQCGYVAEVVGAPCKYDSEDLFSARTAPYTVTCITDNAAGSIQAGKTIEVIFELDTEEEPEPEEPEPEEPEPEEPGGGAYHPEYKPNDEDDKPDEEPEESEEIIEEDVPLAETPWLNTEDHYAYIIGYAEDGTVRPQANITRAEVATIFFRLLTDEARDQFWSTSNNFTDVAADAWYNNAISTMVNAGIIQGYEDGTFRPNANITRAEFAAIASRFMSSGYDVEEDLFTDIANHWARDNINDAAMTKWINGYPDGTFLPDKVITRAEAVTLVNNVLQRKPDKDHMFDTMIKWPDNMDASAWYYEAIQEATNSHDYDLFEGAEYEIWTSLLENRDWAALEKDWVNAHRTGGEVM